MSLSDDYNEIHKNFGDFISLLQDNGQFFSKHIEKTYERGLFDTKTKRLMALCGAIVMGCKGCMLGQTEKALEAGATVAEIMEACSVALALGGTLAGSKIAIVVQFLNETEESG